MLNLCLYLQCQTRDYVLQGTAEGELALEGDGCYSRKYLHSKQGEVKQK